MSREDPLHTHKVYPVANRSEKRMREKESSKLEYRERKI